MRYVEPLAGLLASLWFLVGSLPVARSHGTWQEKAQILLGLCGTILFALMLYGEQPRTHEFKGLKMVLAGMTIGIFVTLWLEGSLDVLTRLKSRRSKDREGEIRGKTGDGGDVFHQS